VKIEDLTRDKGNWGKGISLFSIISHNHVLAFGSCFSMLNCEIN